MSGAALILSIAALTWLVAQTTKFLVGLVTQPQKFLDTGGMPSVHAAVIVSTTTAIGLAHGTDEPAFALAVVVSVIVIHDAVRVRWPLGEATERLNELSAKEKLTTLTVFRGHTVSEVAVGAVYGAALAAVLYQLLYP